MDLATIERYADTLLAPPNLVSAEERDLATRFFEDLKKNIVIADCLVLLTESQNSFVLFQIGQAVGEIVLRDWSLIDADGVQTACQTLLQFVATRPDLEGFVTGACLKSAAMIIKRGILDKKSGNQDVLYTFINEMLTNQSEAIQAAGCLFISALIEQFSSAWRNSKFSITWDFHLQAKTAFENTGLRRLLEMSLTILHALSNQVDIVNNDFTRRLCDRFLEVSENILSWNFSSKIYKRFAAKMQSSNAFRPPISWKDLLENGDFYNLFFNLHTKIRHNEVLCVKSMNCLIQLASLTGDCMPVGDQEASTRYVGMYLTNLLGLFAEGPSAWETNHFCLIINRLFLYRPLASIMRQEPELRARFFGFLKEYTIHLTNEAMHKAIGNAEHDDHASLVLIYDALVVLIRGRWRTSFSDEAEADAVENNLIRWPVLEIVKTFMTNILAPPKGKRPVSKDEDGNDEELEDRHLFQDLFNPLSSMICFSPGEFMEIMATSLNASLEEFKSMAACHDVARLPVWQEDQHWLMLLLANSIIGEDDDGACHLSGDVFDHTKNLFNAGRKFDNYKKTEYLSMCIMEPAKDRRPYASAVDPFVFVMGELFAWAAIEHDVFVNTTDRSMISPQLCRSTFLCLKRFLNGASSPVDIAKWSDYQGLSGEDLPTLPTDKGFVAILVRFVVKKVMFVLLKYSAEELLCQDAVDCLQGLVESYAADIASSPELFEHLNSLDIARLPNRGTLMKALVCIGAAANDPELQENMFTRIVIPLTQRFTAAVGSPSESHLDSQIVDYLQCFDGVAQACQLHSAPVLYPFLFEIMTASIDLLKTRRHNDAIVNAILELILSMTAKVTLFIEGEDNTNFYLALIQIVEAYGTDQLDKFSTLNVDDEEKATDLVLLLDVLSNVLSKDFLNFNEGNALTGARVVTHTMEILLRIMNDRVLQIPDVSLKFFRTILYLVEFSPDALRSMSEDLMSSVFQCMRLGISGQYGNEILSTVLESLTEVVLFFGVPDNKEALTQNLVQQFRNFIPIVFETCLANSSESSIFSEACSALYSLIAFEKVSFTDYVNTLLNARPNQQGRAIIEEAFQRLMSSDPQPGNRRQRAQFRGRMEEFCGSIQGLLSTH